MKYKFKYGIGISAGIQPAMRLHATNVFSHSIIEDHDFTFNNNREDDYSRFDFDLTCGLSWRTCITQSLTIGYRGQSGEREGGK